MKTNIYFISFLIAATGLTACMKSAENPAVTKSTQQQGALNKTNGLTPIGGDTDVYVSGELTDTPAQRTDAVYWKNGVVKKLSTTLNTDFATSTGIVVNGLNVYVSGLYFKTTADNHLVNVGLYWVNGVQKQLPDNTVANGIAVNSLGTVYVSGSIITPTGSQAVYWKDGVQVPLVAATVVSHANGIFIKGTDVYIAGDINNLPVYWKNGVVTNINNGPTGTVRTIFSDGTNVYAAGTINQNVVFFWKNGLGTQLINGGDALGVAFGGANALSSHTYVVGDRFINTGFIGTYWKDGVLNTIPGSISLTAIALLGNDVYIGGFAHGNGFGAAYWKNGVQKMFANGGEVSGIQLQVVAKTHTTQ